MDKSALRAIASQFEIGSHTVDHRYLSSVDDVEAHRQIAQGKTQLEDLLGQAVTGFCYPGGNIGACTGIWCGGLVSCMPALP
ncbi:MAG: polysaccharide deacetylase family protein [Pseudomonadota bacterium]|nr:polysaccharide deacetylase family protein [Pseudomonadota bacterium]